MISEFEVIIETCWDTNPKENPFLNPTYLEVKYRLTLALNLESEEP